LKKEKT